VIRNRGRTLKAATSTGPGEPVFFRDSEQTVWAQVTASGTATVRLQGSIDGSNWVNLGTAASTFSSPSGTVISATAPFPVAAARAVVTALGSTSTISASLVV